MAKHLGHTARKRFGQNFLHDNYVIRRIVDAINPQPGQQLVEIGPGLGALTEPVADAAGHLNVVELDRDLAQRLREHPFLASKLTITEADALKFDFRTLLVEPSGKLRVFGNLPYNISTPLLFHLFEFVDCIQDMHFMLQKEVVDRMAAGPGSKTFGRLSVMTQYYSQVLPVVQVPPGAFNPPPKVDSAVVRLVPHAERPHRAEDIATLNAICTAAFGQRRKTLRNSLRDHLSEAQIAAAGIDPAARPESLSVAQFVALANHAFNCKDA